MCVCVCMYVCVGESLECVKFCAEKTEKSLRERVIILEFIRFCAHRTYYLPCSDNIMFFDSFAFPSGGLLVRRRAWGLLERSYIGGGTILMIDSRKMVTVPRPTLHER